MKALLFFSLLLGGGGLPGTAGPAPAPRAETVAVTVVVTNLRSTESVVKLNFYNAPDKFLKAGQSALRLAVKPNGKTEISVPVELARGEWAVALSQDTNDNGRMDRNFLGIPTEPYAFSNNVRPHLSAPNFEQCKFLVEGGGKVVSITLVP
ncbi:DUF2141 domain-containing protein [Hymenobacter caeli]|uniref:Uncharacterized protein (DUF2141 family) n=1 Tax=Hymenobacter caeli TaxID=2735894 RepID=A0ABX2FMR8_9BACT|nr:DUF2141 domain-containing protein [Hymenobacter caeli]NRT18436.1 uncharacterized protein (DUF2141 family) [Hymenobacter caeli]